MVCPFKTTCFSKTLITTNNGSNTTNAKCIWNIVCINAEWSNACPNGYNYSDYDLILMPYMDRLSNSPLIYPSTIEINIDMMLITNFENSINVCNASAYEFSTSNDSLVLCDGNRECAFATSLKATKVICCIGHESCIDTKHISTEYNGMINYNNTGTSIVDSIDIRCDGTRGCSLDGITTNGLNGSMISRNGGNIYVPGTMGAYQVGIIAVENYDYDFDNINNTAHGNVFCTAHWACYEKTMYVLFFFLRSNTHGVFISKKIKK